VREEVMKETQEDGDLPALKFLRSADTRVKYGIDVRKRKRRGNRRG
jgi:hypothetical protein